MPQTIAITENGLHVLIEIADDGDVRLLHLSALPAEERWLPRANERQAYRLVELQCTGFNQHGHHGNKYVATSPGTQLKYVDHRDHRTTQGRKLEIRQRHEGVEAVTHLQFFDGLPVVRAWTDVTNVGDKPLGLEFVSSFSLHGLIKEGLQHWDAKTVIGVPHNTWYGEAQWRRYTPPELGFSRAVPMHIKRFAVTNTGTWSCNGHLPMGYVQNTEAGATLAWQIEHSGSWHWEISDGGPLYLKLSGPTHNESQWWKELKPGETFTSVPVAVTSTTGDPQEVFAALTEYRRRIRRPHPELKKLPVIFNDYMNCLFGDPTTEKLAPLIDAAAEVGCEYFVIDCGWYADGAWWDGVGEWLPSSKRFPGPTGIEEPIRRIRERGMIPGLWLEIEVMGIQCPLATKLPDSWFFTRHGRRVIDHGRYQLDFRNPAVRRHADAIMHRLVREYGVGYVKMDYNINAGTGPDRDADSAGAGLLDHQRAYLAWLDATFDRYPELVIENCGSGGMRCDYAMLSRHSIQSSSDQTDYRWTAPIASAMLSAVTPEQCAVWSYPLRDADAEAVAFNMINAMLMRIHQSGHLAELTPMVRALVTEGLACYKTFRGDIPLSVPFWPLGLPRFDDDFITLGLRGPESTYVAVWRMGGAEATASLPVPHLAGRTVDVELLYPKVDPPRFEWNRASGQLSVTLAKPWSARLLRLRSDPG